MKHFLIALGFLTKIPVPKQIVIDDKNLSKSAAFFPLVGLVLGFILVLINRIFVPFLPGALLNVILILTSMFLTGAIHLDGFADTIDGFCARAKNKEEVLDIMKDSRIGAMAVIGLIALILFKYETLNSIPGQFKDAALILMCSVSRWSQVMASYFSKYAREAGLGRPFIGNVRRSDFYLAMILTISISLFSWHLKGLVIFILISILAWVVMRYVHKKVGGMTGDTIGFINELAESAILLVVCAWKAH